MLNENAAVITETLPDITPEQPLEQVTTEPTAAPLPAPILPEPTEDVPNPAPVSAEQEEKPEPISDPPTTTTAVSADILPTQTQAIASLPAPVPEPPASMPPPMPRKEESVFRPMVELQNDKDKGIANLAELNRLEVLRTELASSAFKPKIILSYETISFNKACLDLMPETRHINVLIDRTKKRIIILPVNRHAKDALRWCGVTQTGDPKRRTCTARKFGEKLYEMMEWVKENRYRILAYYQKIEGVELLVFNLRECEMVVPEFITTKTGKVMRRGKVYLPDWNGFGMTHTLHQKANEVELDAHYTLSDKDVDVTISDVKIKGKIPTDEEIIMSQYQKEKPREVYANA